MQWKMTAAAILDSAPGTCTLGQVFATVLLISSFGAMSSHAQSGATTTPTVVGIDPLGSYSPGGIDTLNQSDLGLHIDIPLYVDSNARGGVGVAVHLVYDTSYVDNSGNVGWRIQIDADAEIANQHDYLIDCSGSPDPAPICSDEQYVFTFTDATGYTHIFPEIDTTANSSGTVSEAATDGSGYLLTAPATGRGYPVSVTEPSGIVHSLLSSGMTETDTNGNTNLDLSTWDINGVVPVSPATTLTDSSNISVQLSGGGYYSSSPSSAATARNPIYISYTDTTGNTQKITLTFHWATILPVPAQYSEFNPNIGIGLPMSVGLLDTVAYPDGSAYHFTYHTTSFTSGVSDGTIASMQVPTGAMTTYQNTWSAQPCWAPIWGPAVLGALTQVIRTTIDGATSFNRTLNAPSTAQCGTVTSSSTHVIHPDQTSETIGYVGVPEYIVNLNSSELIVHNMEASHTWYSASSALLKATATCYNGTNGNCSNATISLPITQIATTTTLDSGQTSQTVKTLNTVGLPVEMDEYDYGATTPTRKTVTAYASLGNNIINRPSSVTITDGSGSKIGQTTYGYDEYSVIPTSGLPGHSTVSGSRGNLTSKHRWLNTTGSTVDSHWQYDDAGQVLAAEDPNTNWTTYGYDAATDSCRTSVTPLSPNGISQETFATCDPNTGLSLTATDANKITTTYTYDLMLRRHQSTTTTPGGATAAQTTWTYSSPSFPETITTIVAAAPTPNLVSSVVLDAMGRTSFAVAPSGATIATTYNSMGQVESVSNPYFAGTTPQNAGITSYLYDGLGRKTYQCQPDNGGSNTPVCNPAASYQAWTYSGSTVTASDEAGNQSQQTMDALGRNTKVLESNGMSPTASMETDYQYDLLDNLISVKQWGGPAGSPGAISRGFSYDSLSRLITSNNPETGPLSYGYVVPGTQALCSGNVSLPCWKTDARGVTVQYSYDVLNRLLSKTYPAGTASSCYQYDQSSLVSSGGNLVGRLTNEWTQMAACPPGNPPSAFNSSAILSRRSILAYDPVGRIQNEQQCTFANCATGAPYNPSYTYDLAGNVVNRYNGVALVPITFTNSYDGLGHLSSVLSSVPNFPTLFSSPSYTAAGSLAGATYGLGLNVSRTYDSRLRVTSEVDTGNSTSNPTPGTAKITITGTDYTH